MDDKQEAREVAEAVAETTAVMTEASRSQTRAILRVILLVLLVAGLLWVLYKLEGVILLLVLSIFFAYLVAPLVEIVHRPFWWLGKERVIPRALAIGIVYLGIFGVVGLIIAILLPTISDQITQFAVNAPGDFKSARNNAAWINDKYKNLNLPQGVRETIDTNVKNVAGAVGSSVTNGMGAFLLQLFSYLPWFVLIPILAFFLLKDAESFRRSALHMLPRGRWRWRGDEFFQDVNSTLAAYIRAQLTACLIIGVICTIGFWILGVPYFFLLGIAAGLLEFIPLAGPLVIAVSAAGVAGFHSLSQALAVLLFLAVLRIVEDYIIYPRIIGQGIHLHPLAVILAILSGAELAGVAGIFLAIPVIAIATVSYRHWLEHKGGESLVDLLKPTTDQSATTAPVTNDASTPPPQHPTVKSTPADMARARPDLLSTELKRPTRS
ncbi:MAG: AI-2E family transporter [Pyrinomonadaceae bacterium]